MSIAPLLHSNSPYVGTTLDIFGPLTVGDDNTIGYGGIFLCLTSHISSKEGCPILVCLGSYVALRMFDTVSRVVEIVQCLVNEHNGCHLVLCKNFLD